MTRRWWRYLGAHPLVWLIPVLFWLCMAAYVLLKLAAAPQTEFIYDV